MGTVTTHPASVAVLVDGIADSLSASGVTAGGRTAWLVPTMELRNGAYEPLDRTGDPTLYDGSAGTALACLAVGRARGRDDLVHLATQAAQHAVSRAGDVAAVGLYDGLAGIGMSALAVGSDTLDRRLARAGASILSKAYERGTSRSDLIGGLAGIVLALVRAGRFTGDERWCSMALSAARRLEERAERRPWGWVWPNDDADPGLCGLAHGVSGVALALAEAAAASGDPGRFDDAIAGARQFERSWFDSRSNTWPDLRPTADVGSGGPPPPRPARWCHGSVGVGIARIGIDGLAGPNPALQAEVSAALRSSIAAATDEIGRADTSQGFTVCHGLAGTVDFLIDAAVRYDEPTHLDTAKWLAERFLRRLPAEVEHWPGGIQGRPSPGLMNGLAGAMLVLARLAEPKRVASITRLEIVVDRPPS